MLCLSRIVTCYSKGGEISGDPAAFRTSHALLDKPVHVHRVDAVRLAHLAVK